MPVETATNIMTSIRKFAICLGLLAMCTGLVGCAAQTLPYPRLSTIKKIKTKILSSKERDEAMQSLAYAQEQHQKSAIIEIEKSQ